MPSLSFLQKFLLNSMDLETLKHIIENAQDKRMDPTEYKRSVCSVPVSIC